MSSSPLPEGSNLPTITVEDIDRAPEVSEVSKDDTLVGPDQLREALVRLGEDNAALRQDLDATKKRVKTIEILDQLIEPMAQRSFWFMCSYCGMVALMLLLHGCEPSGFKLPESVLQFLVGSTATTVIGLVGMVLTGIFVGARSNGKG
ncbi:MAG: hypothetical protein U9R73_07125 [Pseudomonadota bacterium]|nr:hypothetical protein [Pseudomonadota bacterium]